MATCLCKNKSRIRVGPTGDNDFSILSDRCMRCGKHYPVYPDKLGYKEQRWIMRWNKRCDKDYHLENAPVIDIEQRYQWPPITTKSTW